MNDIYKMLFRKYQNKLAAFLSSKERQMLTEKIKNWLLELPKLF